MKKTLFVIVYCIFFQNILFANPNFPELTGRVVDKAQILSENEKNRLSKILENHEKETSNQIVIVTLNNLEGYEIADFGYQLGRYWKIGQKDKNNGILLIISMDEKRIRIEVGYGLEGVLPDRTAHEIIDYILKPNFRRGDFYNGIRKATEAIIESIKGEYTPSDYNVLDKTPETWFFVYFAIIFLSIILGGLTIKLKNKTLTKLFNSSTLGAYAGAFAIGFFNSFLISIIAFLIIAIIVFVTTKKVSFDSSSHSKGSSYNSGFGGYSSSGGFGGGSFGGGGGSFGGGGASGGW